MLYNNEMFEEVELQKDYPKESFNYFLKLDIYKNSIDKLVNITCLHLYKEWLNHHHRPSMSDLESERELDAVISTLFKFGERRGFTVVGKPDILHIVDARDLREACIYEIDLKFMSNQNLKEEDIKINI